MNTWKENKEDAGEPEEINISSVSPLSEIVGERTADRSLVKEKYAGTVAKVIVMAFANLLVLPLVGGLIAAFASVEQAQAFTTTVVTLLEALAKFSSIVFLPVLTAVLGYYFIQERRNK